MKNTSRHQNVNTVRKPDGRVYYYHRATKTRLPGAPGDKDFEEALWRLNAGLPADLADHPPAASPLAALLAPPPPAAKVTTLGALIRAYKASPEFGEKAAATKADYNEAMDYLQPLDGMPLVQIDTPFLARLRDTVAGHRGRWFVNHLLRFLSMLWNWGRPYGYTPKGENPAGEVPKLRRPRSAPVANRPWSVDEFFAMLDAARPNLRVALALGGFAGLREADICRATFQWWDGRLIQAVAQKTHEPVWIPAHLELRAILGDELARRKLLPGAAAPMLLSERGAAGHYTESGLRASFKTLRDKLLKSGLVQPGLTIHGLRHTAATMLADAGCDTRDIMAITGHRTEAMVRVYTEGADRRRRAAAAVARLESYLRGRGTGLQSPCKPANQGQQD